MQTAELAEQRQVFREKMDERQRLMAPEDLDWARLGDALRWLLLLL